MELTPEAARAVDRIEKLLNLHRNNPNQEEAASALAKAQDLLAQHNLDMALIERRQGEKTGATHTERKDRKKTGGLVATG